ncbi:hypothetical protein [Demequina sp. B12]
MNPRWRPSRWRPSGVACLAHRPLWIPGHWCFGLVGLSRCWGC